MTSAGARRRSRARDAGRHGTTGDVLSYADQGSFLGLRALGRGPVIQCTWVYDHPVSTEAVRQFNAQLARGFLARLVRRSPLPWGRHRWVASPTPATVTVSPDAIPMEQLQQWRSSLIDLPVDPEHGPGWRLAVQPLTNGGTAVSLLISHTIADGLGACQAVVHAVAGLPFETAYPPASGRAGLRTLARDAWDSVRALREVGTALVFMLRRSRSVKAEVSSSAARSHVSVSPAASAPADVPVAQVILDEAECLRVAAARGVTANTLQAAFAARLGYRLGRVDRHGKVKLMLPVSDRVPGDLRGNALRAVTVLVDPEACGSHPRALQRDIRSALTSLLKHGDGVTPLFPLIPYVPLRLARYLEGMALGSDLPVGCTILGELDPDVNRPCGAVASLLYVTLMERQTAAMLDQLGGRLYLLACRLSGRLLITVSAWAPGRVTRREDLIAAIRETLDYLSLTGSVN